MIENIVDESEKAWTEHASREKVQKAFEFLQFNTWETLLIKRNWQLNWINNKLDKEEAAP